MAFVSAAFTVAVPSVPVGSVQPYAGASAPNGWLLCDSGQYLITQYGELYSVLGTTYGTLTNGSGGAGTTHFRVPDMRGRVPMGAGTGAGLNASGTGVPAGSAQTARALGAWGGEETHLLSSAEIPAHSHPVSDPGHFHGAPGGDNFYTGVSSGGDLFNGGGSQYRFNFGASFANTSSKVTGLTVSNNTGGGGRSSVVAPFVVLNYIVKATSDIPRGGITASSTPPIVTSLPANPQFGDQVVYAADATNGVYWLLQYDGSGTYPWKFIGGAPLQSDLAASTTAAAGAAAAGGSPSVAIALPGNYVTRYGCLATPGAVVAGHYCAIQPAFAGAVISGDHELGFSGVGSYFPMAGERAVTFASAGTLSLFYRSDTAAGTSTFIRRYISATPVRVKAA